MIVVSMVCIYDIVTEIGDFQEKVEAELSAFKEYSDDAWKVMAENARAMRPHPINVILRQRRGGGYAERPPVRGQLIMKQG